MDAATQILLNHLRTLSGPTLWLVDEQIDAVAIGSVMARADLFALSNRCDVVAMLAARGIAATLCDFEFDKAPAFQHALFRVAKEKALVHHAINAVLRRLPVGGTLAISGYKNDGTKTYIEKAGARAQAEVVIERDGGALLGIITRGESLSEALPDQDYAQPRRIDFTESFCAWSKPGIFGWQKIDAGSAFLCEHLEQVWPQSSPGHVPKRVLDLGCGYGYLTLNAAAHWSSSYFVATDNNIAATQICERNIRERAIDGRAECCDCGDDLIAKGETFDAILCNPPFHQGFDHETALTEKFLQRTSRLLARGGRALFVVNQFIGLEKSAALLFKHVDVIARNKSFKLVVLENNMRET
ncbi:MAG: methyltransferase [Spongiibacteraceae bacterium]